MTASIATRGARFFDADHALSKPTDVTEIITGHWVRAADVDDDDDQLVSDSLMRELIGSGTWRGAWQAEETYAVGEHATNAGTLYRVITDHISGETFDPSKFSAQSAPAGGSYWLTASHSGLAQGNVVSNLSQLNTLLSTTLDNATDTRTPTAHAASHQSGGADQLFSAAGFAGTLAASDNTFQLVFDKIDSLDLTGIYNDAANSGQLKHNTTNRLTTDAGSYTLTPTSSGSREQIAVFCPVGQTATFNGDTISESPEYYVEEGGSYTTRGDRNRASRTTQDLLAIQGAFDGELIDVAGYYAAGDGVELRYRWDANSTAIEDGVTPATHPGLVCKPTAVAGAGRWIAIVPAGQINARWLGAKGDGIQDDTAYIQRAIDIAFYGATLFTHDFDADTIVLPFGKYLTSDTIHLTYGDTFRSASLISTRQGSAIDNYGTALLPNFTDRPAIAIQGARHCEVVGINIEGVDSTANGFDASEQDESVWDTQYPTAAVGSHNIFCAIAVDPYSGTDPGVGSYPDPTYPAGLGLSAWSKSHSNKVRIRDCRIRFFGAAVAVKPSGGTGADANGDFVKIQDCVIDACKYGLAVGGSQTRMNTIENCQVVDCWAGAAGSVIGPAKAGDIRLVHSNFDRCGYWLYDPTVSQAGYHAINDCRGENSGCIARVINGATSIHTLVVENCVFVSIDTRADSDQEHYHLLAQDCDLVFTGNNVRISHDTNVGRRVFIAAVGDGKVTAHGNTLQYLNTASGDQQTFAEEITWAFPGSFVAWGDVDVAGANPPALTFEKVSATGQQRLIVANILYAGGGQWSGRLHADLRDGQIRTGDYISITPNDSTYTYYLFKITSSDDLDITIEQINDTDNTGLPHNQAAVQAALESAGAWMALAPGTSAVEQTMTGDQTLRPADGPVVIRDPGGASRNLNVVAVWPAGYQITVANTADLAENLTFDPAGLAAVIAQNETKTFVSTSLGWRAS